MTWKIIQIIFISVTYILLAISAIYLRKNKQRLKATEIKLDKIWEKYAMKANEADNLRKRINQTYNKPII